METRLKTTLLVDGDIVCFQSAVKGEKRFPEFGEDAAVLDPDEALRNFETRMGTILRAVREDVGEDFAVVLAFSCPSRRYFRHSLYLSYKSGRKGPRPALLTDVKAHAAALFRVHTKPNLEADDVLGILATTDRYYPGRKIIATCDKDLLQIPCGHINVDDVDAGVFQSTAEEGYLRFMRQTLTGDAVDSYPGCPKVGPKKAAALLNLTQTPAEMWEIVVEQYAKRGLTEQDALVQARLARILQAPDWNHETQEPILWKHPKPYTPPSKIQVPAKPSQPAPSATRKKVKVAST